MLNLKHHHLDPALVLQGRWNKSKRLPEMDKSQHQASRSIIFRSHFVYCSLFKCWKSHRQRENTEWMLPKIASPSLCCVWWPPAGSWRDCAALLCTDCWPDLPALGGLPRAEQVHFIFLKRYYLLENVGACIHFGSGGVKRAVQLS